MKRALSVTGILSCILLLLLIISGCSGGGGGGGGGGTPQTTHTKAVSLGDNFKNVSLTAGVPTEVVFTYTLPPPSSSSATSYKSFSVNLADTMQYVTVSSNPVAMRFNLFDMLKSGWEVAKALADSTAQISAFISYPGDPDVCSSPTRFGPYTITGDIGATPSSETSSASPTATSINITNSGSFELCVVITSPIDAYLTVSDVAVDLTECDQSQADIIGTWTGTYTCTNFGVGNEVDLPVTLTISQNDDGSYHYEAKGDEAVYDGHLCGNTFKFNGGVEGDYTESGTFVLNDDGTASKTSTWNSIPPGVMGGNCTDSLHQ